MDKGIIALVEQMNSVLLFVEDVEILKDKLKHFCDTIEQALRTIEQSCTWIRSYLTSNTAGENTNIVCSYIV